MTDKVFPKYADSVLSVRSNFLDGLTVRLSRTVLAGSVPPNAVDAMMVLGGSETVSARRFSACADVYPQKERSRLRLRYMLGRAQLTSTALLVRFHKIEIEMHSGITMKHKPERRMDGGRQDSSIRFTLGSLARSLIPDSQIRLDLARFSQMIWVR